jgi:hypothetical protein
VRRSEAGGELSWTDAWIFASIGDGGALADLVARADVLNHAIPTAREIARSLERLFARGLVGVRGKTIALTDLGRRVHADARARRGGMFAIVDNMQAALRSPKFARERPPAPRPRSSHALPRFWFVTKEAVTEACEEYRRRASSSR